MFTSLCLSLSDPQRENEKDREREKKQTETHVHVAGQEAHLHASSVLSMCSKDKPEAKVEPQEHELKSWLNTDQYIKENRVE